jgi:hypothetical protein
MAMNKISETTRSNKLSNFAKNTLLIFASLALVLGICELSLRFYNPLGFRMKGDQIRLPINKKEIIYHSKSGKLDEVVIHQKNSLGFRPSNPGYHRRQHHRML